MLHYRTLSLAALSVVGLLASGTAQAGDYSDSGNYNGLSGLGASQQNQAIDPSLRDGNGNLTMVNGVFTSSNMGQGTFEQMSSLGAVSSGSTLNTGGVGNPNVSQAQAIGNSLNVVTVGTGNTVIVNSHQTNNGDQTATVTTNGN